MKSTTESGSRTVLYNCSYVPEELILAAGLQPLRFLPPGHGEDTYAHANTCGYVKSLLGAAVEGAASGAAGIIVANSCDAMRKLYDLWTQYVKSPPALFLDVPKQTDAEAIAFFAAQLRKLAQSMDCELPGTALTDRALEDAIRTCNEVRSLMGEVFQAQRGLEQRVAGTEVLRLCLAGAEGSKAGFQAEIRRILGGLGEAERDARAPRILLTGGISSGAELVAEIENAGGQVVVLDTCIGLRHYESLVEEAAPDPMLALARRYLTKPACARMQGFEQRFQYLKRMAQEAAADGVIFHSLKFCDTWLYDVPLMNQRFRALGMPFLWIESDYTWIDLGQTRTQIAAFLETSC